MQDTDSRRYDFNDQTLEKEIRKERKNILDKLKKLVFCN